MSNYKKSRSSKTPWPTKAVMEQVYEQKLWGGYSVDFYSGNGSHFPELVQPYLEVLISFLSSFKSKLTVCDLGCGDFNVGKELVPYARHYLALDIVPELIKRNKELFKAHNLEFDCLDIAKDELPTADCAIVRQVLQHLSNAEVKSIAKKLLDYKYVIITEHVPEGDFTPNLDIISGQGIRMKKNSGLNLTAPPFNFKVKSERVLLSISLQGAKAVLITVLYEVF